MTSVGIHVVAVLEGIALVALPSGRALDTDQTTTDF